MDTTTPIILYLQECAANRTLTTIIPRLPFNTVVSLLCMGSVLKHLHALTAKLTTILIPYIKATNVLFHQILTLIPF